MLSHFDTVIYGLTATHYFTYKLVILCQVYERFESCLVFSVETQEPLFIENRPLPKQHWVLFVVAVGVSSVVTVVAAVCWFVDFEVSVKKTKIPTVFTYSHIM